MDIQPGGVQDHFPQDVLKFGFGDWKNVYDKRRPNPIFPKDPRKLDVWMGENEKKQVFDLTNWRFIDYYQGFCTIYRYDWPLYMTRAHAYTLCTYLLERSNIYKQHIIMEIY